VAISHEDAKRLVATYERRERGEHHEGEASAAERDAIADRIIKRYARMAASAGAVSGLAGVAPGVGTLVATLGGGAADMLVCMKLQIDMCTCLCALYRHDLTGEDVKHLSFLLAAGAALEKMSVEGAVQIGSKAGVKVLQQYLRGAALVAIRELFKKLGVAFTRKALEKALPFGVGVVIGSGANYALTKYVGTQAKQFFAIERES
jgi:hypothetical protein